MATRPRSSEQSREQQKYQESHTKVSQVFEAIQIPVSFE
ncbi:phenylacetate-CoA oxygenase [Paraburkholderia guartelaensis]|uniref:Phenylacetate-CoA oxygenase n=1 Tax=Paraburkholderia guartelaensis TaxID=2546446 RepID=A0A4R5L591_9BURK|nr:phenylacetate-CoA oxygenase [Paraburkholderia guartelaensis]